MAALFLLAPLLSGCFGISLNSLPGAKADRSIQTGSIRADANQAATETVSDEMTVRNAVTSADLAALEGRSIPWANSYTGSAGVITMISENREDGRLCRQFQTTRHSYQGVSLLAGDACLLDNGQWVVLELGEKD